MSTTDTLLPSGGSAPAFTERQAKAWPEALADAQRHATYSTIPPDLYYWTVKWAEEVRPGRGHGFNGIWTDGEHFVQIMMDVYGRWEASVAALDWLHSTTDENCECEHCEAERAAEEDGCTHEITEWGRCAGCGQSTNDDTKETQD